MTPNKKESLTRDEIIAACAPSTDDDRRCEVCKVVFQNRGAKTMHQLKTHKIGEKEYQEKITEEVAQIGEDETSNESSLLFPETSKSNFQCSDCEKSFKSKKLLVQHFQKVHSPKDIECKDCGKTFALDRDLRYHQTNRCKKSLKRAGGSSEAGPRKSKRTNTAYENPAQWSIELPPHYKIIDTSKMVSTSTQTDNHVHDAGLQVYIEQPYYDSHLQYSTQTDPMYIDQYQQTYGIPCSTYTDWRHTETQTQNLTTSIGTTTPYWPQENGYTTQMTDSHSMTENNYQILYENSNE